MFRDLALRVLRPFFALFALLVLLFSGVSLGSPAGQPGHGSLPMLPLENKQIHGKRIKATGAYQREYWYWRERAYDRGFFPRDAEYQAWRRAEKARILAETRAASGQLRTQEAGILAASWQELGPGGVDTAWDSRNRAGYTSGRIKAILLQKAQNRILIGAASGGIWRRSTNVSEPFVPVSDNLISLIIGAFAADPNNANIIYAGTGEPGISSDSYGGAGILKSTDGGWNWNRVDGPTYFTPGSTYLNGRSVKISRLWVDPRNSQRVLASNLYDGLHESTDGGQTWRRLLDTPAGGMGFEVQPGNPNRVVFSDTNPRWRDDGNLLVSDNGGTSFTPVASPPWQATSTAVGRIDLAFSPSNPSIVWASIARPSGEPADRANRAGIARSTDGGVTWTRRTAVQAGSWYCNPIAVSPANANNFYYGETHLFRGTWDSFNNTLSTSQVSAGGTEQGRPFIHADQHVIVYDPTDANTVWIGCDGGLYLTTDGGVSFNEINWGLRTIQFYYGAVAPFGLTSLIGGTQDNGTCRPDSVGGTEWKETIGGDGFQCAIDPLQTNVFYGSVYNSRYYMSTDSGFNFTELPSLPVLPDPDGNGAEKAESTPFFSPFTIDPSTPTRIYGGAQRVYRAISNRNGTIQGWNALSSAKLFPNDEAVRCIAVAKEDGRIIYASGGNYLSYVHEGLSPNWNRIDPPGGQFITDIAIHPGNADQLVVSRSGYSGGQVVFSNNRGATWTDLTNTPEWPNVPANGVALRRVSGRLECYVATDTGVYYANLNGSPIRWTPVGAWLPRAPVADVLLAEGETKVIAVTHGRGMWAVTVPEPRITLHSPNGGQLWKIGSRQTISWSHEAAPENVHIDISRDGGRTWDDLADSVSNTGDYEWTVTGPATQAARIRVRSTGDFAVNDVGNLTLAIIPDHSISGRVVDEAANGVGTVRVTATTPSASRTQVVPLSARFTIPDNNTVGVESPLTVSGAGTINGLNVGVHLLHTYRGDLEITVIHPDGTSVKLFDGPRNDGTDNLTTDFPSGMDPVSGASALAVFNGRPLAGTWKLRVRDLSAVDTGTLEAWSLTFATTGPLTATADTDANGNYTLTGLFPASYTVKPTKTGYTFSPTTRTVTIASTSPSGIDFTGTRPTYSISGKVATAYGEAVSGVTVTAGSRSDVTAADGTYTITGLLPGSYTLTPAKAGLTFSPVNRAVTVSSANLTGRNFTAVTYAVKGRVATSTGAAVGGVTITAGTRTAVTASTGYYDLKGLLPGDHTLVPSKTGLTFTPTSLPVTITGANLTGKNFTAVTYTLSGKVVTGVGAGVGGVTVKAGTRSAVTASTGVYTITGLLPGDYTLVPSKTGLTFTPSSQPVTITASNLTGQNFTARTYSVLGKITTATGVPVEGATVKAGTRTGITSATGTYTITGLLPGTYTVRPTKTGVTFEPVSRSVTITNASVTGQNFTGSRP